MELLFYKDFTEKIGPRIESSNQEAVPRKAMVYIAAWNFVSSTLVFVILLSYRSMPCRFTSCLRPHEFVGSQGCRMPGHRMTRSLNVQGTKPRITTAEFHIASSPRHRSPALKTRVAKPRIATAELHAASSPRRKSPAMKICIAK
jgi:hypothetical protein